MSKQQQQAVFEVGGMACAFCATTIEEGLAPIKGIESVKVIMNTSEVVIRYDPSIFNKDDLKHQLGALGYYAFDENERKDGGSTVLHDSRKRTISAAAITAPIVVLAFLASSGIFNFGPYFKIIELAASGIVLFYFGLPIHIGAFNALRRGILNEHVLYGAAGFAAYTVGLVSLFYPNTPDFLSVAALLTTFHLSAGWYGAKVRNDTTKSLRKIIDLQPPMARTVIDGKEKLIHVEEVKIGGLVLVKGGEKIPVDGTVESGESEVSEAILTGEANPALKKKGDSVLAGSTNGDGLLTIKVTKVSTETFLMRIAGNVKDIQERKPLLLTVFDKVIDKYVRVVLGLAGATAVGWVIFDIITHSSHWLEATYGPLSVLVIGYPCALGLSAPSIKLRALTVAADNGILVNDASSLFLIPKAKKLVLDKTGTLTEGKPQVTKILSLVKESDLLRYAASVEQGSSHPIARAIVQETKKRGIDTLVAPDVKQFPGRGVSAHVDGHKVILGTREFVESQGISMTGQVEVIQQIDSPVLVAVDDRLCGILGISDSLRPQIESKIRDLKGEGFEPIILTGDTQAAAQKVATRLDIQFKARMSPLDKANYIKELQSDGPVIAVGDGVNDAPALAQADAGIAVGSGIDITKETAPFVLLTDDIGLIPSIVQFGKKFSLAAKRNILLALGFNVIGIPIAMAGLLNPMIAMIIMIFDVSAIFLSGFVLHFPKIPKREESRHSIPKEAVAS
ncbi:MAG: cadmium-translocating P-type ATPase [Thaumarchaeota archaeon]|nr:cadmium-translocating P-type ATPase [Nitrososphaerota archaeon]